MILLENTVMWMNFLDSDGLPMKKNVCHRLRIEKFQSEIEKVLIPLHISMTQ